MKRSNDEIYFEETKRKEIKYLTTCQVMITLDETIGSKLLHHKFKYLTSELQLFLQHVPVLYWYPLDIVGTTFDHIDSYIFSAVIRNNFYNPSNKDLIKTLVGGMLDFYSDNDENIQKIAKLLKGLLNDELFILQALEEFKKGGNNKNPLEYISDQLKDDEKFMLKAIKISGRSALEYASDRLRKILLNVIENDQLSSDVEKGSNNDKKDGESDNIQYDEDDQSCYDKDEKLVLDSFKSNSKLEPYILHILKENDYHLFRSFNRLNDNEQIVKELNNKKTDAIKYASDRLKDNEEFILGVLTVNGSALSYASNRLKDDEEFILKAVKLNGEALQYVSDRFKDNEIIVLEAVKENISTLKYASERLQDNEIIVLEAVKLNGNALKYASNRLKDKEEILLEAVRKNGCVLEFTSDRLKDNEKIVLEAIKQNGYALEYASDRFKDNETIMLEAVKEDGCSLKYASERLKENEQIVLEAVKENGKAIDYAADRLKNNEEFVLQTVKLNGEVFEYVSYPFKDNEEIVMEAIKQDSYALNFASERLQNDFSFANEIFKNCKTLEVFEYFGEELRNIEFIYYYIENYQSKFHELMRNNIHRRKSNAYNDFFNIIKLNAYKFL